LKTKRRFPTFLTDMRNKTKIGLALLIVTAVSVPVALFLTPDTSSWADPTNAEAVALGSRIYAEQCADCHGAKLQGETANWRARKEDGTLPAPPHDATGHTWHHGDRLLFDYIKEGGAEIGGPGFKSGMPGFADVLTEREIWATLAFIKSKWPENIRRRQAAVSAQR
jgi:mono/diheme cytochrome c family protein